MTNRLIQHSFSLSVLLHLLLLLSLIFYIHSQPTEHKYKPVQVMPSYVYTGAIIPTSSSFQPMQATQASTTSTTISAAKRVLPKKNGGIGLREIMASSYRILEENQRQAIHSLVGKAEPIYMIGDINGESDPLIILLGRALSKHFQYPEIAGKFGIAGRALIKLTLQPEGNITDVIVVESSNNHELDSAALYAVNAAPRIKDADHYIKKPKTMVIGFIFRIN